MLIRLPWLLSAQRPGLPGPPVPPALGGRPSPTWRCPRCGTERHFPGPVPAEAVIPCAACGANAATAVRE